MPLPPCGGICPDEEGSTGCMLKAREVTFECPSCGAPIHTQSDVNVVACEYCGNTLMVPEELRAIPYPQPQLQQFEQTVVINLAELLEEQESKVRINRAQARAITRSPGCIGSFITLIIILSIVGG